MGRRGPPPTPTDILAMRGSWRAKTRSGEPRPEKSAPRMPSSLSKEEQTVWRQVMRLLETMGVLARCDGNALRRYVNAYVRWESAAKFIAQYGETFPIKDADGKVKCFQRFPQATTYAEMHQMMLRIEQEFGLTPAARARLAVTPPTPITTDTKERYFRQA